MLHNYFCSKEKHPHLTEELEELEFQDDDDALERHKKMTSGRATEDDCCYNLIGSYFGYNPNLVGVGGTYEASVDSYSNILILSPEDHPHLEMVSHKTTGLIHQEWNENR